MMPSRKFAGLIRGVVRSYSVVSCLKQHSPASSIAYEDLVINMTESSKVKPDASGLKFGAETTDHMLQVLWKEEQGWLAPEINPVSDLKIHPCAQVLHYGMECFEGMKAYKDKDKRVRLFRPEKNMERLLSSARRLALPEFDKVGFLKCIKRLVRLERDWIPEQQGFSLYIRPSFISTHACLGVQATREAMLFVILSPVGAYFQSGLRPVNLFVDTENVRAFRGGVGDKKLGGNYGPSVLPQIEAMERGCSQVLFVNKTDGLINEAGSMNMFFLFKKEDGGLELVTPALDGTILPGITRDTVLSISRRVAHLQVSERSLSLAEIETAAARGCLLEAFGTGTACMIQPVAGLVKDNGHLIKIPFDLEATNSWIHSSFDEVQNRKLPFTMCGFLTRTMTDIQYGHVHSDWSVLID